MDPLNLVIPVFPTEKCVIFQQPPENYRISPFEKDSEKAAPTLESLEL